LEDLKQFRQNEPLTTLPWLKRMLPVLDKAWLIELLQVTCTGNVFDADCVVTVNKERTQLTLMMAATKRRCYEWATASPL